MAVISEALAQTHFSPMNEPFEAQGWSGYGHGACENSLGGAVEFRACPYCTHHLSHSVVLVCSKSLLERQFARLSLKPFLGFHMPQNISSLSFFLIPVTHLVLTLAISLILRGSTACCAGESLFLLTVMPGWQAGSCLSSFFIFFFFFFFLS